MKTQIVVVPVIVFETQHGPLTSNAATAMAERVRAQVELFLDGTSDAVARANISGAKDYPFLRPADQAEPSRAAGGRLPHLSLMNCWIEGVWMLCVYDTALQTIAGMIDQKSAEPYLRWLDAQKR